MDIRTALSIDPATINRSKCEHITVVGGNRPRTAWQEAEQRRLMHVEDEDGIWHLPSDGG